MNLYKTFLNNMYSIKLWGGYIAIGDLRSRARPAYSGVVKDIKVGSIVGRRSEGFILNAFSSKRISHTGIYLGEYGDYKRAIIHAAGREGVVIDELYNFIDVNYVEVWNYCIELEEIEQKKLIEIAVKHLGQEYDYSFNLKNDKFYCSELVANIYKEFANIDFIKTKFMFKVSYKPDNFIPESLFTKVFSHNYYN